jgi:acetyl-CoA synthetase
VGEAGVVGVSDPTTGEAIAAFVIPSREVSVQDAGDPVFWAALETELSALLLSHVSREIGPIAKPRDLVVVPDLPKTRSGKIMRRLLGDLVDGRTLGDTTSLQDETVPARIAHILAARR